MQYTSKDNKSIEHYFSFACGEVNGEPATHLRYALYFANGRVTLTLTPAIRSQFGYTMNIGINPDENPYNMSCIVIAPRFNKKTFEALAHKYHDLIHKLITDNTPVEQWHDIIADSITL